MNRTEAMPKPITVERLLTRFGQFLAVGEAEVIVGAEIQHALTRRHRDLPRLLRRNDPFGLVETVRPQGVELAGQMVDEGMGHDSSPPLLISLSFAPRASGTQPAFGLA